MTAHPNDLDRFPMARAAAAGPRRVGPHRVGVWVGLGAVALLLAVGGSLGLSRLGDTAATAAPSAPPPPAVTVSPPLQRRVAGWTSFTGQFSAVNYVEIRAQVSGYLSEIRFTDGQIVHQGDLLFVIDPRPYEIQLQQATAQQQTAAAQLELANKQLARSAELKRSDRVSVGSLVSGGPSTGATTLLTTIVSLDPIHLDFEMSEADYLSYQRFLQTQQSGGAVDRTVEASLSDEQGWPRRGVLDFLDNQLDRSSGTIHARASLANPDLFIAPGQFARLRLPVSEPRPVLLVPDAALTTDQSRKLVMTVGPDGTVVPKVVEIGALSDGLRIVRSGLAADDQVVINGLMRARPGAKVTPQPGSIAVAARG